MPGVDQQSLDSVRSWLGNLQQKLIATLESCEPDTDRHRFRQDPWQSDLGQGLSSVLEGGDALERACVLYSHIQGASLPEAASKRHPELAGRPYAACGVSVVVHPRHPMVPACHLNVRYFHCPGEDSTRWWFGGGYDLSPCYAFEEDCQHWHRVAKAALDKQQLGLYEEFKKSCDAYFYLPHRQEMRGIGGLFFDDFDRGGFPAAFAVTKAVGESWQDAWVPLFKKRSEGDYSPAHKMWQLYRRGRYAEFNLAFDRGTKFGLQSGGRTEAILASLPPQAAWHYRLETKPGTPEHALDNFLQPQDWTQNPSTNNN